MASMKNPRAPRVDGSGALVVIGGAENKEENPDILEFVAQRVGDGRLAVMTCATSDPEAAWKRYRDVFTAVGVRDLVHVDFREREDALDEAISEPLEGAAGVFFTGGDQLRITARLGGTPAYRRIAGVLDRGGVVAGTSAGAAVMSETMLVTGGSDATPAIRDVVKLAPGFGFLRGAIVDMHFAERGRLGRLLGAIAQNPQILGIGIDENTAIVVEAQCLTVIGAGGVYIADGSKVRQSNVAEGAEDETLTIDNVILHVLNAGRRFDLATRLPSRAAA